MLSRILRFNEVYQVWSEARYLVEVRIRNEVFVFNKVFNLIIVIVCESFGLASLQVLNIQLEELVVFNLELLELLNICPIENVAHLNVAHGLQLNSFQIEAIHSGKEGGRET